MSGKQSKNGKGSKADLPEKKEAPKPLRIDDPEETVSKKEESSETNVIGQKKQTTPPFTVPEKKTSIPEPKPDPRVNSEMLRNPVGSVQTLIEGLKSPMLTDTDKKLIQDFAVYLLKDLGYEVVSPEEIEKRKQIGKTKRLSDINIEESDLPAGNTDERAAKIREQISQMNIRPVTNQNVIDPIDTMKMKGREIISCLVNHFDYLSHKRVNSNFATMKITEMGMAYNPDVQINDLGCCFKLSCNGTVIRFPEDGSHIGVM